jgi:hypothetical protein
VSSPLPLPPLRVREVCIVFGSPGELSFFIILEGGGIILVGEII